jgi:hypothetical protein
MGGLREVAAPFVALGPSGVAVRDRLKGLTVRDEEGLRLVGDHLGTLGKPPPHPRTTDTIRARRTRSERGRPGRPTPFGAPG